MAGFPNPYVMFPDTYITPAQDTQKAPVWEPHTRDTLPPMGDMEYFKFWKQFPPNKDLWVVRPYKTEKGEVLEQHELMVPKGWDDDMVGIEMNKRFHQFVDEDGYPRNVWGQRFRGAAENPLILVRPRADIPMM